MLKKVALIVVIVYSSALTTASLMTLRNLPDVGVSFGDKIFHFLAYFVLAFLWFFAFLLTFSFKKRKAILFSAIISIAFGILIEVLQESLTVNRALDVYDMLANTFGVILAVILLSLKRNISIKKG